MMTETRTSRRARTTRDNIFTAAMELFASQGVSNVSMQDIADRADTAHSTVFKHFPRKMDLLEAFFLRLVADTLDNARAQGGSGFREGMKAVFVAIEDEAKKVEPLLQEVAGLALGNGPLSHAEAVADDQLTTHISRLVAQGIETGEIKSGLDVREVAGLLLAVITATNHEAIARNRIPSLAKDHLKRFEIMMDGLGAG